MKGKELLRKISSTEYSMSTMYELFRMADCNEEKADKVAKLIDEAKSEEELLKKIEQMKASQA